MRNKAFALLTLILVIACALCGCSFKNETLDAEMAKAVTNLNVRDGEALFGQFYPIIEKDAFLEALDPIYAVWQETDPSTVKLVNINIKKNSVNGEPQKIIQGVYALDLGETPYYLSLVYLEKAGESGLYNLNLNEAQTAGGMSISTASILSIAVLVVLWALILITVIDILRKRPRRWGWYVLWAIVLTVNITLNGFAIPLPIGVLNYWCRRKGLLRRKAELLEAQKAAGEEAEDREDTETEED